MKTYPMLAEELGFTYCGGVTTAGFYCPEPHQVGSVAGGILHFADRTPTRLATLSFLRLAAQLADPTLVTEDRSWRYMYRRHLLVRELARQLDISVATSRLERAAVLAGVAGVPNNVPLRKQAFDWARRGPRERAS